MNNIYVFVTTKDYSGGMRFISAKNKKAAIDKTIITDMFDENYHSSNYFGWKYIGTLKQFEKIVRKQKDYEDYYAE